MVAVDLLGTWRNLVQFHLFDIMRERTLRPTYLQNVQENKQSPGLISIVVFDVKIYIKEQNDYSVWAVTGFRTQRERIRFWLK